MKASRKAHSRARQAPQADRMTTWWEHSMQLTEGTKDHLLEPRISRSNAWAVHAHCQRQEPSNGDKSAAQNPHQEDLESRAVSLANSNIQALRETPNNLSAQMQDHGAGQQNLREADVCKMLQVQPGMTKKRGTLLMQKNSYGYEHPHTKAARIPSARAQCNSNQMHGWTSVCVYLIPTSR